MEPPHVQEVSAEVASVLPEVAVEPSPQCLPMEGWKPLPMPAEVPSGCHPRLPEAVAVAAKPTAVSLPRRQEAAFYHPSRRRRHDAMSLVKCPEEITKNIKPKGKLD